MMAASEKKSCASCAFCCEELMGYSEYTITGSVYTCFFNANPGFPLDSDSVPGEREQQALLEHADSCEHFREGARLCSGCVESETQEEKDWLAQFKDQESRFIILLLQERK